jgi:hypothetical protein
MPHAPSGGAGTGLRSPTRAPAMPALVLGYRPLLDGEEPEQMTEARLVGARTVTLSDAPRLIWHRR